MNDQTAQMMNQHQQIQASAPPQQQQQQQMMNQNLPKMMNTVQFQPQQQMMMNQPPALPPSSQMMNRSYGMWMPPPQMAQPSLDQMKFQKHPNPNGKGVIGGFGSGKLQNQAGVKALGPRNNWKGKGKRVIGGRRNDNINMALAGSSGGGIPGGGGGGGGYQPPTLNELQHQNRVKARRFFPKKKYNPNYHTNYNSNNNGGRNMGKFAPRNTTSFLIRAKKSGGIAELVSPYPVTPAVLPTPMFSPSKEVLVDMAKEEWGVDGYGSMKGLIRLRSPGREDEGDDDDDDEGESSESDVEDHVEVERRLDHDLSRFEMIYPNNAGGMDYNNLLENRVDDQDTHIAHLEEENLILKDRLFLMDRELGDLRRRLRYLERHNRGGDYTHEEVLENESDSETESRGESRLTGINHEEFVEENTELHRDMKMGEEFEGDMKVSKGNDGNVGNAADASLGNSMELDSKTDADNNEMPLESEVPNHNDESVTKKYDQTSEVMDEIQGKDVAIKDETDIDNRKEEKIVGELGSAADASLGNSMELESKTDTDNNGMPLESEVSNHNDETVTKKFDQTSEVMDEIQGKDVAIKDETDIENRKEEMIVGELRSAPVDMLSMRSEKKDEADDNATTKVDASDE